jgi:hypothetical protein
MSPTPNATPRLPGDVPAAAWFGLMRAWLAVHGGMSTAQINKAIGQNVNGRTRAQIADALAAWLRVRD